MFCNNKKILSAKKIPELPICCDPQTETALMYDAVLLFAHALHELDKSQVYTLNKITGFYPGPNHRFILWTFNTNSLVGGSHPTSFVLWWGDLAAWQLAGQLHEAGRDGWTYWQGEVRQERTEDRLHPWYCGTEETRARESWILAWKGWDQILKELHENLFWDCGKPPE